MNVAPDGGTILEEVLRLSPMERAGGFEHLLEVLRSCPMPVRLRSGIVNKCDTIITIIAIGID